MISIIIPAFNESENIEIIANRVSHELKAYEPFEIIFIDDGSTDATLEKIKALSALNNNIKYISFSRNFGHQKALMAGIEHASGDCVISMDADMQHPPEIIKNMLDKWKEGYDIVYSVRRDTTETGLLKKITSGCFYKLVNKICEIDIPLGSADFRLLDRKVVLELRKFKENWLFLRGIIAWLGFKQIGIEYVVQKRHAGKSKYSFRKMLSLSIQGITSFSIMPLRIAAFLGILFSIGSFIYIMYALYAKLILGIAIVGWTSVLISVLFLGGIQLIFLGILGEYLGKMFIETKNRPNYIINEKKV
ncbi:MAG: glycosyltransferase family 2 protein [Desulfomonilia bacterium]